MYLSNISQIIAQFIAHTVYFNIFLITAICREKTQKSIFGKKKYIHSQSYCKICFTFNYNVLPKRDEVTGEWRKLHNEELRDIYSLPNIVQVVKSRKMRWAAHVTRLVEGRGVHRILVGKPEGKRSLWRPRRRWEDNIKMDLHEVGGGGIWMELAQDRDRWRELVNTLMNFRVP